MKTRSEPVGCSKSSSKRESESECEVIQLCPTLWDPMDGSLHAPLSIGFFRQEYWSGLPFPFPEDLPHLGIKLRSPKLQADALPSEPPEKSLRGKFTAIQYYLKKLEKHQVDNLTLHLRQLEKEEQANKQKNSGRKEIIKIQAETYEKEMKNTIVKINKTKNWFFEKINKIDKPLAGLIKKNREKNQINKIRSEKGEVTVDNAEIERIIRAYYEQLYGNKMDNLEEMDRFLEKFNLPRLNQEEIEIMKVELQALKLKL